MKLSRRSMFPLAAAGVMAAADGSQGASIDPNGGPGILVKIHRWHNGQWMVLVPDIERMERDWMPGHHHVPVKLMRLDEYLKQLDEMYTIET
jgi:hypothetical protein